MSKDAVELATRALSRHDRSRRELEERLAQAGIDEAERAEALDTLERIGYLDEGRFASSRADTLAARGQGDAAIRFDLERRGLEAQAIEDAFTNLEAEELRAARLAERLGWTPKLAAQLRRKGFSEESIAAALRRMAPEL